MVVRLSTLHTGLQPFTPKKIPGTHFCYKLSQPHVHSVTGRIRSIEKSNDLIGNRTWDLPACSIVPQPTTQLRAPHLPGSTEENNEKPVRIAGPSQDVYQAPSKSECKSRVLLVYQPAQYVYFSSIKVCNM
jgi:hypothetical protein